MPTIRKHPLVGADFQSAYGWYETERAGLGLAFAAEFRAVYHKLRQGPLLYAVRFSGIRRVNLVLFLTACFTRFAAMKSACSPCCMAAEKPQTSSPSGGEHLARGNP